MKVTQQLLIFVVISGAMLVCGIGLVACGSGESPETQISTADQAVATDLSDQTTLTDAAADLTPDPPGDGVVSDLPGDVALADLPGAVVDATPDGSDDTTADQVPPGPTATVDPPSGADIERERAIVITFDQLMNADSVAFDIASDIGERTWFWSTGVGDKDTLSIEPKSAWSSGVGRILKLSVKTFGDKETYSVTLTYAVGSSNGVACTAHSDCKNGVCCGDSKCGGAIYGNCCNDANCSGGGQWCDNSYQLTYTCVDTRQLGEGCDRSEQCKSEACNTGAGFCTECLSPAGCPKCTTPGEEASCCGGKCGCYKPNCTGGPNPVCISPCLMHTACLASHFLCNTMSCCSKATQYCTINGCAAKLDWDEACAFNDKACKSGTCDKASNTCTCSDNTHCPAEHTCNDKGACVK